MGINRFDIYFITLDPAVGSEIKKIRPCVIVSPNEMNRTLNTLIVAPLTSTIKNYPMRVNCFVEGRRGQIALDHLRSVDKIRLKNKLASLSLPEQKKTIETLIAMFS